MYSLQQWQESTRSNQHNEAKQRAKEDSIKQVFTLDAEY